MKLLGLDASLSNTGYCVLDKDKIVGSGVISTNKNDFNDEDKRINYICDEILKLIKEYKITDVVVENQFMSINSKTVLSLRKMLGAIMRALNEVDLDLNYLYPTTIRKVLLNNGKAKKEQVAKYIQENIIDIGEYSNKANKNKTSDIYDAIAVAIAFKKEGEKNEKTKSRK